MSSQKEHPRKRPHLAPPAQSSPENNHENKHFPEENFPKNQTDNPSSQDTASRIVAQSETPKIDTGKAKDDKDTTASRRFRPLSDLGRQLAQRVSLEDTDSTRLLTRLTPHRLTPRRETSEIEKNPTPTGEKASKAALVRLLQTVSATSQSGLARAGIGGLEALAALLDTGNEDIEAVPLAEEVCVGFTDIEGFTTYTETYGDDAALALLRHHSTQVDPLICLRGGMILKRMGDGYMLRFPNAQAAVAAMLDCLAAVSSAPSSHPGASPLRIRAGLTFGKPLRIGNDLIGSDVNLAARLTNMANGGQLLVNKAVKKEAEHDLPHVSFIDKGKQKIKGFEGRVQIYEVKDLIFPG